MAVEALMSDPGVREIPARDDPANDADMADLAAAASTGAEEG